MNSDFTKKTLEQTVVTEENDLSEELADLQKNFQELLSEYRKKVEQEKIARLQRELKQI